MPRTRAIALGVIKVEPGRVGNVVLKTYKTQRAQWKLAGTYESSRRPTEQDYEPQMKKRGEIPPKAGGW